MTGDVAGVTDDAAAAAARARLRPPSVASPCSASTSHGSLIGSASP